MFYRTSFKRICVEPRDILHQMHSDPRKESDGERGKKIIDMIRK